MKTLTVITSAFVTLALLSTNALAQESPQAEKRQGVTYYSVAYAKKWWKAFAEKAGGMEQAREIWQRFLGLVDVSKTEVVMTRWAAPSPD